MLLISGNPAHVSLASLSLQKLWNFLNTFGGFNVSDATFIDFGCGTGLALLSAMTQPFQHVIGIELDKHSSEVATDNVIKFKNSSQGAKLSKCYNVSIACSDMQDFVFKTVSTPTLTTLFSSTPAPPIMFRRLYSTCTSHCGHSVSHKHMQFTQKYLSMHASPSRMSWWPTLIAVYLVGTRWRLWPQ